MKIQMKKIIVFFSLILLNFGCSLFQVPVNCYRGDAYSYQYNQYLINIESIPSGALIEPNNEFVGYTPRTIVINGSMGNGRSTIIKATPAKVGFVKTKYLYNPLPHNIIFNINIPDYLCRLKSSKNKFNFKYI